MENQKHQCWTVEEEKALCDGVAKHGVGKWRIILNDPQFSSSLINRSNIDLKDKWRNLGASTSTSARPSTGPWYKTMIIEALSSTDNADGLDVGAIQSYIEERGDDKTPQLGKRYLRTMLWKLIKLEKLEMMSKRDRESLIRLVTLWIKIERIKEIKVLAPQLDKWRNLGASTSTSARSGTGLWYKKMIFEALSSTNNADGLDVGAIQSYIEERGDFKTPQLGKRYIRTMLWKLIKQEKLEMNGNGSYKIKHYEPNNPNDGGINDKQQTETEEDANDEQIETDEDANDEQIETDEHAAAYAAYKIAVAEHKERELMKAIQEQNKLEELQEESISMLALAEDIYEKCERDGMVMLPLD